MKRILFSMLCLIGIASLYAQVGINTPSPHASAALDIVSTEKGLLIPRMTTAQRTAIATPAEGLLVYDTDLKCISQNAGTSASPVWVCLSPRNTKNDFFYMPSIAIDASATATNLTLNLYDEYKKQFTGADATQFAKSNGAPATIPFFPSAASLYYYITYYDNTVLQINSIDADGKVLYDILSEADYSTFMNVVFVVK